VSIVNRIAHAVVSATFVGGALTLLVGHAAIVQGADPHLSLAGAGAGVALGLAYSFGQASLRFVGVILGSVGGLQFFRCFPCDGSPYVMPLFGAFVCGILFWILQGLTGNVHITTRST
jgi:hypothetical protein